MNQNNCTMRKLNVHLVAVATKSLQASLKRCDWRERKRPHTGPGNWNTSTLSRRETKKLLF